jgi:hypothetical protein
MLEGITRLRILRANPNTSGLPHAIQRARSNGDANFTKSSDSAMTTAASLLMVVFRVRVRKSLNASSAPESEVLAHIPPRGQSRSAAAMLMEYGFLLATAPLTEPVRRATLGAIALLPGLRLCATTDDLLARGHFAVCTTDAESETEILIDAADGTVRSVTQRIAKVTRIYPDLQSRAIIESCIFSL